LPRVFALELAIVGYAIAGWRRPRASATRFTATNGWSLYAGVFAFLCLVETPVVHVALRLASRSTTFGDTGALHAWSTAAWIATALSLYSVVWLAGDAHALRHGGVIVGEDALELRLGVRWRGRIPWAQVASITRGSEADLDASILGANTVIRMHAPVTLRGPLGRMRTGASLALSLDDPDGFADQAARRTS
jgi:hypothetical protein